MKKRFSKPPREDVAPIGRAPLAIRQFLERVGGFNPFSEPNYRLVLAQHVMQQSAGEWNDFPDDATLSERGGLDFNTALLEMEMPNGEVKTGTQIMDMGPAVSRLLRTVIEMRWEQKHPDLTGWMLQRWYPGTHPAYGDREKWEGVRFHGLQALGPFPVYGDYEHCSMWQEDKAAHMLIEGGKETPEGIVGACLKEVPPIRVLHKAICAAEDAALDSRSLGASRNARMLARLNEWSKRETDRKEKRKERNHLLIKDHMSVYRGSSLESARCREALAKKAGITSHVGA